MKKINLNFNYKIFSSFYILLFTSLFLLTGCDDNIPGCVKETGKCYKYDHNMEKVKKKFQFQARPGNLDQWVDTNINVPANSELAISIDGIIDLCGKVSQELLVDALLCSDFSSPKYDEYDDKNDIGQILFTLDPKKVCSTGAFHKNMRYLKTNIFTKPGDRLFFELIPEELNVLNCKNIPKTINLQDFKMPNNGNFNSQDFCNNYIKNLHIFKNSILYQPYINNQFGPRGNKVFLNNAQKKNNVKIDKGIIYHFPKIYLKFFEHNILNIIEDRTVGTCGGYPYYRFRINRENSVVYPSKMCYDNGGGTRAAVLYFDESVKTAEYLRELDYAIRQIQKFPQLGNFQIDAIDVFTDILPKLIFDYRAVVNDNLNGVNFLRYLGWAKIGAIKYGYEFDYGRFMVPWEQLREAKKTLSNLSMRNNNNTYKVTKTYLHYTHHISSDAFTVNPKLLNTIKYNNKNFNDLWQISGQPNNNNCKLNFSIGDAKKFLQLIESQLDKDLATLASYRVKYRDIYEWQVFEAELLALDSLSLHAMFCWDANDGQSFSIDQIKNSVIRKYNDFVDALKKDFYLLDQSNVPREVYDSILLFPFWQRASLVDFSNAAHTLDCNKRIYDLTNSNRKFDLFTINQKCNNICDLDNKDENCVFTVVPSLNAKSGNAGEVLGYQYDQSGYYTIYADRLIAKIDDKSDQKFNSSGTCIASNDNGVCTKNFRNVKDSLMLNHEYLINDDGELMLMIVNKNPDGYGQSYGGYNVRVTQSCANKQGENLYYYIGDIKDIQGKKPLEVKAKKFSDILKDGTGYLRNGSTNAKLYVYMEGRQNTANYSGSYDIDVTSSGMKMPISSILNPIFDAFESKLYGVRNSEGQYVKDGIIKKFYDGFLVQGGFNTAIQALVVLFITITVFGYMTGILSIDRYDMFLRLIKVTLMGILISPSSWYFFNDYMFTLLRGGSEQLVEIVMSNNSNITGSRFLIYDRIANYALSSQTWERIGMMFLIFPLGFFAFWFLLIAMIDILVLLFKGLIIYFSAVFVTAILLGLAPLYISFVMFHITRKLFDGWLKQLMSYAFIPVFYFATITLCFNVILNSLNIIFNFEYCVECGYCFNLGYIGKNGSGDDMAYIANAFFPPSCLYEWPKPKNDGLPFTFSAVLTLMIICKLTNKVVDLSKIIASSVIGFLPNAGSIADLGDKVTQQIERGVGLDNKSKSRRNTAARYNQQFKRRIGNHMQEKANKFKSMNKMFELSKNATVDQFSSTLGSMDKLNRKDKEELWEQFKQKRDMKDDRSFEMYAKEEGVKNVKADNYDYGMKKKKNKKTNKR